MALRELPLRTANALTRELRPTMRAMHPLCCRRRSASTDAGREVEAASSFTVPPLSAELVKGYDPVARSRLRRRGNKELPPSRCAPHATAPPALPETATTEAEAEAAAETQTQTQTQTSC
jgi:hypothetical protein